MKIPLYYFKDFKKEANSKYENTIQKFLGIKHKSMNENVIMTFSQFVNEGRDKDLNSDFNIRNRNIRDNALRLKAEQERLKAEQKLKPKLNKNQKSKLQDEIYNLEDEIKYINDDILELEKYIERINTNMDLEAGEKVDSWNDEDANIYGAELEKINSEIEDLTKEIDKLTKKIKEIENKLY